MLESIPDSEWMYLMASVIYSKIMTKKEADNLAQRITFSFQYEELPYYKRMEDFDD